MKSTYEPANAVSFLESAALFELKLKNLVRGIINSAQERKLDLMVALHDGWHWYSHNGHKAKIGKNEVNVSSGWEIVGDDTLNLPAGYEKYTTWNYDIPYYSSEIEVAWKLGNEWLWSFDECDEWLVVSVMYADSTEERISVLWKDFQTKAKAYATGRCRAWLLARLASGNHVLPSPCEF